MFINKVCPSPASNELVPVTEPCRAAPDFWFNDFCTSKNEGRGRSNVPEFCRHIRSKRPGTVCDNLKTQFINLCFEYRSMGL